MFKLPKQNNKQAKSGERVDFRFSNFQALQEVTGSCCGNILLQKCKVPKGWDRLSLSIICVETGKTIAKLGKTLVKNGSCQWPETLLESVWILQDDSSLELEESLYKFVVSMGSARSGILGEGTINLASYVGSRLSSPVLLPLKKCNQGTTLQVKIHCLTPRNKFRDESKSSGSNMKEQDLDHDITSKSNESDNLSAGSDGLQSTQDIVSNSGPSKFEIKERSFSASGSNNSFSSAESFTRKVKFPSTYHIKSEGSNHTGKQVRASPDIDNHIVSDQSSYNTKATGSVEHLQNNGKDFTASSLTNSGSSRNLLEAAEDTIEELRIEAKMWERNARKLMLDLDILREEFSAQSKKQADLVMDLSAAYSERGSLKKEIENLKLMLEESMAKHALAAEDSVFQSKGQNHIQEELEIEIRHQQELNASLALQLKGSQESNVELLSLLQELEETIEQQKVEIEKFSSLQLRLTDMKNSTTADSQDKVNFLDQFQQHEESEDTLRRDNGQPEKASGELIRDLEALREKVQELERDCAELTQENLDLLIKFKESNTEITRETTESIETEKSGITSHIHYDEENLDNTLTHMEKVGANEKSKDFIQLVKQLEVAFHHLKRPWYKLSSGISDKCQSHLDSLANLIENGESSHKVSASYILTNMFELNHLLETRIVEYEELLKQHEEEIQERNNSVAEAQRKLEVSKAELQVQCLSLQKELDQTIFELDKLQADLQTKEEEKNCISKHQRELEARVTDLQKERDAQVSENKLLERKLAHLDSERHTLEDQLVGLTEKNINMEAQIRLMTVNRESRQSELEESRTDVMNLQEEIGKLESEMKTNIADLKEELEDMQILWSQAREECGHLTNENEKLQESLQNLLEEYKTIQQSNSELERKNVELHERRLHVEAQLCESQKSLSNSLIKVKALEENLNSMWKDFSLKEERLNVELTELIRENKNEIEKLVQQECLSTHRYSEKLTEVESLNKEVEQLTKQISEMDEERRLASDAANEVSSLRAENAMLVSALEDIQSKLTLTEKELSNVRIESELKIQDSRQSFEKLTVDHEKILKHLSNYRANEEKLKTAFNDLELQLTLLRYEHQKLHEESANLKFQLQKTKELQEDVDYLKSELKECMSEKEKLEASLNLVSVDCEEMKAEKASFASKISSFQKVLSELENSNRKGICLEEKVEKMESDLTEKEKFCAQVDDLKNELSETKRENEQYQQKIHKMEEEKDNCFRKVQALEAEVKMMEEEKKLYAKKFEQNDTPKSTNKYTNFNRVPQKLNQSQELLVDRLHSDFESEGENGIAYSVEVDYLARIQLLENKLAEALEANKKYKIQLQRFKTEERKGHSPSSRKPDGDSEMVKRFERTKTLLETELKDIRERYFQMSLKYAEVEAQREDLVMKLKAAKSGKKWFS
ncbi:intracellular protein transport protein USO1-like isoform X1 [Nicotiana tomentosiformis]|uniref:intracellular protein transport protein USO1-like isoform X1 n=1 Tax=Nicotiana tomentosiformis TaxID=4098 RepID=UPI00388CBA63